MIGNNGWLFEKKNASKTLNSIPIDNFFLTRSYVYFLVIIEYFERLHRTNKKYRKLVLL